MQVDLSPVIQSLLGIAAIGITSVGTWAIAAFAKKIGIDKNTALMANLDDAAMKAISAGVMTAQDDIKAKGWDHPDVQNKVIAAGASYVTAKFTETLAQAGIDPTTGAGQQAIKDLVTRALPAGIAAAAASPTTPPVPTTQKGA